MGLRPVPNTELYVSPICLGTMTFGTPVGQAQATARGGRRDAALRCHLLFLQGFSI